MAVTAVGVGSWGSGNSGGNPVCAIPTVSGGVLSTDMLVIVINVHKASAQTESLPATHSTRANMNLLADAEGGSGATGTDTGPVLMGVYTETGASIAGVSGNVTTNIDGFTSGSAGTSAATRCFVLRRDNTGEPWDVAVTTGADATDGTSWSVTFSSDPGIASGDLLVVGCCFAIDTAVSFSSESLTATGATIDAPANVDDLTIAAGVDCGGKNQAHAVSAGSSSAAPVWTATLSASRHGPAILARFRHGTTEVPIGDSDAASVADSESVAAGISDTDAAGILDLEVQAQAQTDTVTLNDTEVVTQGQSDTASFSETETVSVIDSDTFTTSDSQAQAQSQVDTLSATDGESISSTLSNTDIFNFTDVESQVQSQTDSLVIVDVEVQTQSDADTISVVDSQTQAQGSTDSISALDAESTSVTLGDSDILSIVEQDSEPGNEPVPSNDSDSLSFTEVEVLTVTDSDTLIVSDAQSQAFTQSDTCTIADTESQSMSDADTHTVGDAQQLGQVATESFTLEDAETFAATLSDTDPFTIADLESLDAGDAPAQIDDSDVLSIGEDEFTSLFDVDSLDIVDEQTVELVDSDTLNIDESEQSSTSELDSGETFQLIDQQSIGKGTIPFDAVVAIGSEPIEVLTGNNQTAPVGSTLVEVHVGSRSVVIEIGS